MKLRFNWQMKFLYKSLGINTSRWLLMNAVAQLVEQWFFTLHFKVHKVPINGHHGSLVRIQFAFQKDK